MKTIYMPEVTSCDELFSRMEPWNIMNPGEESLYPPTVIRKGRETMEIGPFVSIRGRGNTPFPRQFMAVTPSPQLMHWIEANGVVVNCDRMSFKILVEPSGNCLVVMNHTRIIGSYWLTAALRVESLPSFIRREG